MQETYKVTIKRPFEVIEELLSRKSLYVSKGLFAKTNIGGVHDMFLQCKERMHTGPYYGPLKIH